MFDNLAAVQRQYDRQLPPETEAADDWTPIKRREVLDGEVEDLIASIGARGWYEDELGHTKFVSRLHRTLCAMWVRDRASLGEAGPELWQWARDIARRVFG